MSGVVTGDLPRISIVTPSYNQAQFLEATMRSVLDQGYPNLEYLVLDGGSTDGSLQIIERYRDRLAYWVSQPDRGQADAINRGFARATGDILAWLNSDDTYEPGTLLAVAEAFVQNPGASLVYGEGWYIDEAGERIRPCRFVREAFEARHLANRDPILQQAAFWSRDLWTRVGPASESLNWVFDWDWFCRAREVTQFCYVPRFLANYRVHGAAKTRSPDVRRREEQAWITRTYGAWWHPNYLVQRLRIVSLRTAYLSGRWPRWLGSPVRSLATLPARLAEFLFHGMYTT
jgi:glycosyltransferase involved in cell wall biosynthesis